MSEITDKLRADAAWAGARTATTVRQIGRDCEEAADYIDRLEENRENHKRAYDESEMALAAKIQSLAPHGTCGCSYDAPDDLCDHHSPQIMALRARVAVLEGDKARLDYLDSLNAALNAHHGTKYGWDLIVNPNIIRLHFKHMSVDLNDATAHGFPSCRVPIDRAMAEYAARRALTPVADTPNQDGKI